MSSGADPAEEATARVRRLLLSGDNTLKNRHDAEGARRRFEEALALAREAGLDDVVTIIERRLQAL